MFRSFKKKKKDSMYMKQLNVANYKIELMFNMMIKYLLHLTASQPFHLLNGSNLSVGFIEQSHVPFIYSTTNAIYVAIPYTGNDDYFVVGVPKTRPTSDKGMKYL